MLEARDARLPAGPPRAAAAKPPLVLVRQTVGGAVTGLGNDDVMDAEIADSSFPLRRVEPAIDREQLRRPREDRDVAFNGRYRQRRVIRSRDDADVGDDAA